jgi:hypothetical protein
MSRRVVSAVLLAAAVILHFAYTAPGRRDIALAQESFGRARAERARLLAQIARQARGEQVRMRVAHMDLKDPGPSPDPAARLRQSVLEAMRGLPLSGVHLSVTRASAPLAATMSLQAQGGFPEIVKLSGRLVRPGAGLVLETVRFSPAGNGGISMAAAGVSLEGRP